MFEDLNDLIGKKLKDSAVEWKQSKGDNTYYIITRPNFYSDSMHINMRICFDENNRITGFDGNKCYSAYRGMYNRSAKVHDRDFTKRDIQYLRKFVKDNTEE